MSILPKSPPSFADLMTAAANEPNRWTRIFQAAGAAQPTVDGRYIHWNKLRHLTPPDDLTREEWWTGIRWTRRNIMKRIPVDGVYSFSISNPDPLQQMLCDFDRNTSGRVPISDQIINPHTRERYVVNTLIEESISSSQIEGANTERRVASDMIRSGRKPQDKSERMIMNNYLAMNYIRRNKGEPLTVDMIRVLHRMVTDETLPAEDLGRFRTAEDNVVIEDPATHEVLFVPPDPANVQKRLELLCAFANGKHPKGVFIHPAVRAILLHFWLAYEHPFVDGNGRTARALFYWSMLNSGYWLCEYISISRIVYKGGGRYRNAFLYSETDENDATYFVLYNLEVVLRAIDALHSYLKKKMEETNATQRLLRQSLLFNHRQVALLSHATKHPEAQYTIKVHATSHQVVYQTARTDLLELQKMGLLIAYKAGNAYIFGAAHDLESRLKKLKLPKAQVPR